MKKYKLRGYACRTCLKITERENDMGNFDAVDRPMIEIQLYRSRKSMPEECYQDNKSIYVEVTIEEARRNK
jgi:hypothetical protein